MIRLAKTTDLENLKEIYGHGRTFIKTYNSPQWQNNYPSEMLIKSDIAQASLYVFEKDDKIVGVMTVFDDEATYSNINGAWLSNKPYKVIHRIATHKNYYRQGISASLIDYVFQTLKTKSIRIDTHELNKPMQNMLLKNGFKYCGTIYLNQLNDRIRLAYQKDI